MSPFFLLLQNWTRLCADDGENIAWAAAEGSDSMPMRVFEPIVLDFSKDPGRAVEADERESRI